MGGGRRSSGASGKGGLTWKSLIATDSFVSRPNKAIEGTGNGEAKLHLGAKGVEADAFFGPEMTPLRFQLSRENLLMFMRRAEPLYKLLYDDYRGGESLRELWGTRIERVSNLPETVEFTAERRPYRQGETRAYLSSKSRPWSLIRELPLSRSAVYEIERDDTSSSYWLRLIPAVSIDIENLIASEGLEVYRSAATGGNLASAVQTVVERVTNARRGQHQFKREVVRRMPMCPFTGISAPYLLRASHIKPWRHANDAERLDGVNGITLTPTFDVLFDGGFISFEDNGSLIVSNRLNSTVQELFNLFSGQQVLDPEIAAESSEYLAYHRENEFLG